MSRSRLRPTDTTGRIRTVHVVDGQPGELALSTAVGWRPAGPDAPDVVVVGDPRTRPEDLPRASLRVGVVAAGTAARWRSGRILDDLDAVLVPTAADARRLAADCVAPPVVAGKDVPHTLRQVVDLLEARPRVHLVTGVSELRARHRWGDHHYAVGLARALHAAGWLPRSWCQAELADVDHGVAELVVLLAGKVALAPVPGVRTVAWVISHPERLDDADPAALAGLDALHVASTVEVDRLQRAFGLGSFLAQATDPTRFLPTPGGPRHELLFVANSRGQRRKVLEDLLPTERELAVYGRNWTPELLGDAQLIADHVPNAALAAYYTAADVVLADHWDQMRTRGFVSNRLFDASACGALVLSDDVPGIADLFHGTVATFADGDSLRSELELIDAHPGAAAARATAARRIVLAEHTFEQRLPVLLDGVTPPTHAVWPGVATEVPAPDGHVAARFTTLVDAPRPPRRTPGRGHVDDLADRAAEAEVAAATTAADLARVRGRRSVRLLNAVLSDRSVRKVRQALRPSGGAPRPVDPDAVAQQVRRRFREIDADHLSPPPVSAPTWKVGHLGGVRRFARVATHVDLADVDWAERTAGHLDLVLLEPAPGWTPPRHLPAVLARCREVGIPTVLLTADDAEPPGAAPTPWWDGLAIDHVLREGPEPDADLPLGVAVDRWNPRGWRAVVPDPIVCSPQQLAAVDRQDLAAEFPTPRVLRGPIVGDRQPPPTREPAEDDGPVTEVAISTTTELTRALRGAGVLVDDVRWHATPTEAARLRLGALALGVPVVAVGDHLDLTHTIPAHDVAGAVTRALELLADPDLREQVSITGRRAVMRDLGDDARFATLCERIGLAPPRPPLVTVLISTNRPSLVDHALATVAAQNYPRLELVLVLHGDGHAPDDPPPPRTDIPTTVLRAPAAWTLGDCLNAGIAAARGDLIAKVDDDDLYGEDHLTDLVLAQRHSHADLVGKRVEFVHLAADDVTVRRAPTSPERFRTHVSGPTLLLTARTAREVGFLKVPRRVDSTLCERVDASGGRIYRTHSRDIVLVRHQEGHTWDVEDTAVRDDSVAEVTGDGRTWASSLPRPSADDGGK